MSIASRADRRRKNGATVTDQVGGLFLKIDFDRGRRRLREGARARERRRQKRDQISPRHETNKICVLSKGKKAVRASHFGGTCFRTSPLFIAHAVRVGRAEARPSENSHCNRRFDGRVRIV